MQRYELVLKASLGVSLSSISRLGFEWPASQLKYYAGSESSVVKNLWFIAPVISWTPCCCLQLFCKSNRQHFLWDSRHNKPCGMWKNTRKACFGYQISYKIINFQVDSIYCLRYPHNCHNVYLSPDFKIISMTVLFTFHIQFVKVRNAAPCEGIVMLNYW